jgi:diphthine synthase
MLYLVGIGLADEKDITVKGLEIVRKCDKVYLENYTSKLQCSYEDLERFYMKKITLANRETSEQGVDKIISEAKDKDVAFLIIGDPFSATTHSMIFKEAKEKGVKVQVINNASILTAIGKVGLELYKYGKTTSIPFPENIANLETPYLVYQQNLDMGLHTLFLLDLHPQEREFMTINEALDILKKIEEEKENELITDETIVIGCARLGSEDFKIKSGKFKDVRLEDFGYPPYCLIIPGKMHFVEEEMVDLWN